LNVRPLILSLVFVLGQLVLPGASQAAGVSPEEQRKLAALRDEARSYEHGEGVPRDGSKAAKLYCEAAAGGDMEAQYSLGWMYANGRGVARDDAQAAYFFTLAAKQGQAQAQQMLRFVGEPSGTPECMRLDGVDAQAYAEATPAQRKLIDLIRKLAPEYGVSAGLALAVARTESNFNSQAVSQKNAQGLMQLIPDTSERFNVKKPFDPEQNVRGGLAYLRWLLAYFQGNVPLVVAGYNAGEGAVNKFHGIPPYPETRDYVKRIMTGFKKDAHPFDASITEPSPELQKLVVRKIW
jgi:TPR repeat protein